MPSKDTSVEESSDSEYEYETESETDSDSDAKTKTATKTKSESKPKAEPKPKPKNDADIIKAILDAYLATRINGKMRGWTDFKLGGKLLPSSHDVAGKLRAIIRLVDLLPNCNADDMRMTWLSVLTECKREELVQRKIKDNTRGSYLGFGKFAVGEEARFEQTLCAIRSYIVNRIKNYYSGESFLKDEIDRLAKQKSTFEQKYQTAKGTHHANPEDVENARIDFEKCALKFDAIVEATTASDYYKTFFTEYLSRDKRLDKNGGPLVEDNFDQFKENTLSGDREIEFLDKLMAMDNVLSNPKATTSKSFFSGLTNFLTPRAPTDIGEINAPKAKR